MKRILGILAVVALVAMTVQAVEVKSENVAGVVNVSVPANGLKIVGVNLDAFDAGSATLLDLLGGQLTEGGYWSPGSADQVIMWDISTSSYKKYGLRDDDHQFHDLSGTLTEWQGAAVNPVIGPGDAFWLAATSGNGLDVSLTGQAVEDSTMQVDITNGLQFVCYPLSSVVNIQDTDFYADGAIEGGYWSPGSADQLILWNGTGYEKYGIRDDDHQFHDLSGTLTEWQGPAVDVDIALGEGFWFNHGGSGFAWTEDNQYLSNL
jgi:hypothetical protein